MRLAHYYDLHLLTSLETFDWALIVEQAVKLGWTYTVDQALTLIRDYFGTPYLIMYSPNCASVARQTKM